MSSYDIAIVGAGLAGVSTARHCCAGSASVVLIDPRTPLSLTSAASGENFRNWWPHPVMTAFTNDSIDRMARIAGQTANGIEMETSGYLLATRKTENRELLLASLARGYGGSADIRVIDAEGDAPGLDAGDPASGVDVVCSPPLIQRLWPQFDPAVRVVVRIRRAGRLSVQQLGQVMLAEARANGLTRIADRLRHVDHGDGFRLSLDSGQTLRARQLVIAAGPFINQLVSQFEAPLPLTNILQQKIAFEDHLGLVPRNQPYTVDLDAGPLAWQPDERTALAADPDLAWLAGETPGGSHCRPDGNGQWVKLGWAYNNSPSSPQETPDLDPQYPEIALRGAVRLHPALARYLDQLPSRRSHYGGYYTMTEENWPLIGPLKTPGAFVVGALSGFGTMAACAAGALCAGWMNGDELPAYARPLSLQRYEDDALLQRLRASEDRGLL